MVATVKKDTTKENVKFDKKRMTVALNSNTYVVPKGLTREEKRAFILSAG